MVAGEEVQRVRGVIEQWKSAIAVKDVERRLALWDSTYPHPIYVAEDFDDPFMGWDAIGEYYAYLPPLDWRLDILAVDVVHDAAYVFCTFFVKADVDGVDHTLAFDGRTTFVLRKAEGGWKIIHYHESLSRDHSHESWGYRWN